MPALNGTTKNSDGFAYKENIAFGWYGGKFFGLAAGCCRTHYCEPFAGSGAVLLNRPPAPVETYNDLDGEVVNFFRKRGAAGEFHAFFTGICACLRGSFAERVGARPPVLRPRAAGSHRPCANCFAGPVGQLQTNQPLGHRGRERYLNGKAWIAERLLRAQIENRPATDVIKLYDHPDVLLRPALSARPRRRESLPVRNERRPARGTRRNA